MKYRTGLNAGTLIAVGPLPEGLKDILRIVADGECRTPATEHVYERHGAEEIRAACARYLASTLFDRKSDPYRTLGLVPGARPEEVRENKRLLLKWLHPDRNPDARERSYLGQVLEAAEAIEVDRAVPAPLTQVKPPHINVRPGAGRPTRTARPSPTRHVIARAAAEAAHYGKVLTAVGATTVVGLISWRFYMNEPIGTSLERCAKLTLAMLPW